MKNKTNNPEIPGHDRPLPLVSVVVLNYNGKAQIEKCFRHVLSLDYPNYEIIFVDNGSDDSSLELAEKTAEESTVKCSFIRLDRNLGYSRGKNLGASHAKGKYLWLLDNDIAPDPDCLVKLVEFIEHQQDIALCGPVLTDYNDPERIVGGGLFLGYVRQPRKHGDFHDNTRDFTYSSYISGAVMFVRMDVWKNLGGFDESGMFFLDDHDFGPRCWISGWKVAVVHDCSARHLQISRDSHSYWRWRFRQFAPSTIRGMIRNYSARSLAVALPSFVTFTALKSIKNSIWRKDPRILVDGSMSILEAATGIPESMRQRRKIQGLRTVQSDLFLKLDNNPKQSCL